MKEKVNEFRIYGQYKVIDGFIAIFQNKCTSLGCYYAEDDWEKEFLDSLIAPLIEKCSRFDARHKGYWKVYPTKLILFELDGKEFSIEIEALRSDEPSKLSDGTPMVKGHTLINQKIYDEEKQILKKETEKREQDLARKEKQKEEKAEKDLYNKLKKKFETERR